MIRRVNRRKEICLLELYENTSNKIRNEIIKLLEQKGAKYKAGLQLISVVAYPEVVRKVSLMYFKHIKNTYFKPNYSVIKVGLVETPVAVVKHYGIYDFTVNQRSDIEIYDPPCFPSYKAIKRYIKPDPKVSPVKLKLPTLIVGKPVKTAKQAKAVKPAKGLKPLTSVAASAKTPVAVVPTGKKRGPIKSVKT